MKKILLTTTGLIALGMAPAAAADLPARPYTKAPAAAIAINNWTGFYLGAMGGYAQENTSDAFGRISGGFAGGTLGYNWQTGNLVLGVEADAAWADVGVRVGNPAHRRGQRPGFATWVPFVAASATPSTRSSSTAPAVMRGPTTVCVSALNVSVSDSQVHSGWTLGAGVEVMFAPKWSVKAEYLYRSFQGETYFAGIAPRIPTGTLNLNSVQVGVNYHF